MKQILVGAQQVVTCRGPARSRIGPEQADLEVIERGAVVIDGATIVGVGREADLRQQHSEAEPIEVRGVLFPGLVDAHTHSVFGAARVADHERRALGVPYKEIAAQGGGILESVRDVRARTAEDLANLTRARLEALLRHGATTVEVKSGYGLDLETEIKQLEVLAQVSDTTPQTLVPTLLGAHEIPAEFRPRRTEYVDHVVETMIPEVARRKLARYCDVFCEPGVFTVEESRRVLTAARTHGLGLRIHADEIDASGGAELAAELRAASADHLAAISAEGVKALAASSTVAVLLPGTMLFLGKQTQAPARLLIESGVPVALATDLNPGSSPSPSLTTMMTVGMSQMGLRASEAVIAVTVNAAASLGLAGDRGQIAPGFRADLTLFAAEDWREVPYWYGTNIVAQVWCDGLPCLPPEGPVSCWITGISDIRPLPGTPSVEVHGKRRPAQGQSETG